MLHTCVLYGKSFEKLTLNEILNTSLRLRPGDYVRVKSPKEILDTLDELGSFERLPFMPEMLDLCGKVYPVISRADKTCDTATRTGGRQLTNTVHLAGQRCSGSNHGGCQAACLLFWKEVWLEVLPSADHVRDSIAYPHGELEAAAMSLSAHTSSFGNPSAGESPVYSCQATRLPEFTEPLSPWDMRQYWRDFNSNRVGIGRLFKVAFYSMYTKIIATGFAYRIWVGLFDAIQRLRKRPPWPYRSGALDTTPTEHLNLAVGELVRVKAFDEILKTLNKNNKNRGLFFDAEMVRFCGKTYRVQGRVDKIINEETGQMMNFGNPCIILEDVWCSSDWSPCRRLCPRAIYHYWREIWLERVPENMAAKIP